MPIKITLKITLNLKILKKQLILAKFSSKKKLLIKLITENISNKILKYLVEILKFMNKFSTN
jgi:hypothetical protein